MRLSRLFRILSVLIFLTGYYLAAQSTVVSGTLVDQGGVTWINAKVSAVFVPTPGVQGPFIWSGGAYNPQPAPVTTDGSGNFTITLPSNNAITPAGSQWQFVFGPNASAPAVVFSLSLTTPTLNISTTFTGNAPALLIQSMGVPRAYATTQLAIPPNMGQLAFNTTSGSHVFWTGSTWNNLGSGGGITPGGTFFEIQTNLNNTALAGSNMFTNSGHTENYSATNWDAFGYNGNLAYTSTDYRSHETACWYTSLFLDGAEGHTCHYSYFRPLGPGVNYGGTLYGNTSGWTVSKYHYIDYAITTPGISQVFSIVADFSKSGDAAAFYAYCNSKGGWTDPAGEGVTCIKANGGNSQYFFGATTTTGTGVTAIVVPAIGGGSDILPAPGTMIANLSVSPVATGFLTSYTNVGADPVPAKFGTSDSHAVSQYGDNLGPINVNRNTTGQSFTVNVHLQSSGSFVNGFMIGACVDAVEFINATVTAKDGSGNQQVTGNFHTAHNTNKCRFYQGGIQGIQDQVANSYSSTNIKTSVLVVGSESANQISVRLYIAGAQSNIPLGNISFGTTFTGVTLNRASNITQMCSGDPLLEDGNTITISGATDSTYNGTFANIVLDNNNCATWSNTGANGSTTGNGLIGGTSAGPSTSAYNVFPAAMIQSIGTTSSTSNGVTSAVWNGTINLWPNNVAWTSGNTAVNFWDPATKINMLAAEGQAATLPTDGRQIWSDVVTQGMGVSSLNYSNVIIGNTNSPQLYYGGTGGGGYNPDGTTRKLPGARALEVDGPWQQQMYAHAPLANGFVQYIDGPVQSTSNPIYNTYYPRQLNTYQGLRGYYETYNGVTNVFSQCMDGVTFVCLQFGDPAHAIPRSIFLSNNSSLFVVGGGFIVGSNFNFNGDSTSNCALGTQQGVTNLVFGVASTSQGSLRQCTQYVTTAAYGYIPVHDKTKPITIAGAVFASGTCTTVTTITFLGSYAGASFTTGYVGDPTAVVGWGASGGMELFAWGGSDTISYKACNVTGSSITAGTVNLSIGVNN